MPNEYGIWNAEEALEHHDFCYELARYIGDILDKDKRVIDFGCGRGNYLRYLHDRGFEYLMGIEGEVYNFNYFDNIRQENLARALPDLGFTNHNSVFLEVGEHIPAEYENIVLDNIAKYTANKIIMSWAVPGQDGHGHVNCRDNVWVLWEMEGRGFKCNWEQTLEARSRIQERWVYFRNTLLILDRHG